MKLIGKKLYRTGPLKLFNMGPNPYDSGGSTAKASGSYTSSGGGGGSKM
jgi:hypothetical protein